MSDTFDARNAVRLDFTDMDDGSQGCRYTGVDPGDDPQRVADGLVQRTRLSPYHKGIRIDQVLHVRMGDRGAPSDQVISSLAVAGARAGGGAEGKAP